MTVVRKPNLEGRAHPGIAHGGRLALVGALTMLAFAALASAGGVARSGAFGPAWAQQYQPNKITICHHTRGKKGTKHVTIRINRSAWRAHQRHGDTLGACSTARNKGIHKSKAHAKKFHKPAKGKGKGR
jgi:hypothetical protein